MHGKLPAAIAIVVVFLISACRPSSSGLKARCAESRNKGIEFLVANQQKTGGFATYNWRPTDPERKTGVDTGFTVSQVLYSLTFCRDSENCRAVSERAAAYLLAHRESPGVWRYY